MTWLGLRNKTAIVTGAASGIGAAISKALIAEGCHVLMADVQEDQLYKVAENIRCTSSTTTMKPFVCDVTDQQQVQNMINDADKLASSSNNDNNSNRIANILINCAGITKDNFSYKLSQQDYERVMKVNVDGTYHTCQYFCQPSRLSFDDNHKNNDESSSSSLSIVNMSSVVGKYGNIGQLPYATSKGAVLSLTKSLAKEMAFLHQKQENNMMIPLVRVNAIVPGFIDNTAMTNQVPEKIKDQLMQEKIALKHFGTVHDIANLTLFLSSSLRSSYITGECIECSGLISL